MEAEFSFQNKCGNAVPNSFHGN